MSPILVRSGKDGKYEILSGHNRVKVVVSLGHKTIKAIVIDSLSDDDAMRIVIDSNLNQQSFSDWKYSQQLKVIKIHSKYIKENSQQGKRNDLYPSDETCDQSKHMSDTGTGVQAGSKTKDKPKRLKTRDKMAKQLGISSTTFVRYNSIANLEDDILHTVGELLDEKRLSFMGAFNISKLKTGEIKTVLALVKENPDTQFKTSVFRELVELSTKKDSKKDLTKSAILNTLTAEPK